MTGSTRAWRSAIALTGAALALASCGGQDNTAGPAGGTKSAGPTKASSAPPAKKGDGTLTVGQLLPQTGDLAFLGPPEFAGVDLAVKEINAAGGVLGNPVKSVRADSGDGSPNIAPGETDNLLAAKSDVIVGAASSSVSLSVIDKIVNAGVVQISPANTSTAFDTYDDKGLYFRTAPSDKLQGAVLANLILQDGYQNIGILARQDSYGQALADQVEKVFTSSGGKVVAKQLYDPDVKSQTAPIAKVAAAKPDAVVLIAFNETVTMIPDMQTAGIGPQDVQVYFTDGNTSNYGTGKDGFPRGTLAGVRATYPGGAVGASFQKRLKTINPKLKDFTYGPESYDATVLAALAAIAAGDDAGTSIATKMQDVSRDGTKCTSFKQCASLLKKGTNINYEGVSGPIDFNDTGSPSAATIGIFQFKPDNTYYNVRYVQGQI